MGRTIMMGLLATGFLGTSFAQNAPAFRPPAVPLVTLDPYTSVWSASDALYDSWPMHWTGKTRGMSGMIRVDGRVLRFMGTEAVCEESLRQISLCVAPTQTTYMFEGAGIELTLTFTTPMLPGDLAFLSAPVTFLTYGVRATDGQRHDVALYFDASAEWVVNKPNEKVVWNRPEGPNGLTLLRFGSKDQPVLKKDGDDIRINWGYLYVAVPTPFLKAAAVAGHEDARRAFHKKGRLPAKDDKRQPRAAEDDWPVIACMMSLGKVAADPVERHLILA